MNRRRESGFSLVEVMIALLIGAMIIAGMYQAFNLLHKWWISGGVRSDMRQNARAGMETLTRDLEMAGYQTTTYGDIYKTGIAITFASAHEIEMDQQRPDSSTIGDAEPVYQPRLVYYHLATDMRTGRQNLYRQIRTQPGLSAADELVAENISEFELAYFDKDNAPVAGLPPALPGGSAAYSVGVAVPANSPLRAIRRIQATLTTVPAGATTLAAATAPGDATMAVGSTNGFPPAGSAVVFVVDGGVVVGEQTVSYTDKDDTHFFGAANVPAAAAGSVVARPMPIGGVPRPLTLTASVVPPNLSAADEVTADDTPPAVPTGPTVLAAGPPAVTGPAVIDTRSCRNKLRVRWNPNADPDLAGYLLFYGATGSFTVPLRAIDKNDPRITLNPHDLLITKHADRLTAPNTYAIQVAAYDSSGNVSAKTAAVSGNPSPDTISFAAASFVNDTTVNPGKPSPPAGLTVVPGAAAGELVVSWQPPGDESATAGYRLYRSTAPFGGGHVDGSLQIRDESSLTPEVTTWTDTNRESCTAYHYAVASVNCDETLVDLYSAGDYATASGEWIDATPPPAPGLAGSQPEEQRALVTLTNPLEAASAGFDRTEIFWSKAPALAPHLDGTLVVDGVRLPARESAGDSPGVFRRRGTQVIVFDREAEADPAASLVAGDTYTIFAVSYDRCGNVSAAASTDLTILGLADCVDNPPGPPPASFTGPTIASCPPGSAVLGWAYPGRDALPDLSGFRIRRSDLADELTDGATLLMSWTDAGPLQAGAAYTYTVTATDCVWEQYLRALVPLPYPDALNTLTLGPIHPGGLQKYVQNVTSSVVPTSAPVNSGDATIPIDAAGIVGSFAAAGELSIGCHRVAYTGIDYSGSNPVAFTGCVWPPSSAGYAAPGGTPVHQYDWAAYAAPENFVTSDSDASQPYSHHNNVKFHLQNTSSGRLTIKRMAVSWDNPNVVLQTVVIGGAPSGTTERTVNVGGAASGVGFSVDAEIEDVAGGAGSPSGPVPLRLRFTTPDGSVNRLTDMRNETLTLSLWVGDRAAPEAECPTPARIAIDVPRGPILGDFSQSAPGRYGIDSYEVVGQSATARDTDIRVPYGIAVNVYGTVFDNSRDIAPDRCNMGFVAGYPKVVGIGAAAADAAAVPAMPTTGDFFERPLFSIGGDRYAIYRASPAAGSLMPEFSNEVVWYNAIALDNTGNWDRVPTPDYGNYAYLQPPFDVCTVSPAPPTLTLASSSPTGGAFLTWTEPAAYDNGIAIAAADSLTYDVYVKSAGGDPWPSVPTEADLTGTSFHHAADLAAGAYYYMVRAKNSCAPGPRQSADSNVVAECEGAAGLDCSLFTVPVTARYGDPIALSVTDFCAFKDNNAADSVVFRVTSGGTTTDFTATESGDNGVFATTITAVYSGGGGGQVSAPSGSLGVGLVVGGAAACDPRTVTLTGGPCSTTPKAPVMGNATRNSTSSNVNTLTFTTPTQNTDNTPLLDLAGYRLIYSTSSTMPTTYTSSNSVNLGLVASPWTGGVGNPYRYYFWLQAYDSCAPPKYSAPSNRVRADK